MNNKTIIHEYDEGCPCDLCNDEWFDAVMQMVKEIDNYTERSQRQYGLLNNPKPTGPVD